MKTFCCLILSLVAVLLLAGVCQGFEDHDIDFEDHSYRFVNTKVSFAAAKKGCEGMEMELLELESPEEKKYLTDHIATLGLDDEEESFWAEKDPDSKTEYCNILTSYAYIDAMCDKACYYICEGEPDSSE